MARFADSAVSAASVATASARLRSDTRTAVARAVTDMVARKSCDSSKALLRNSLVHGSESLSIPHIANVDSRTVAAAVLRGPNRNAAHSSSGRQRKSRGKLPKVDERPKTPNPTRTRAPRRNAASMSCSRIH